GIRDFHVTGVQTCALPISPGSRAIPAPPPDQEPAWATEYNRRKTQDRRKYFVPFIPQTYWSATLMRACRPACPAALPTLPDAGRSEERRVGKECRCRLHPS